jgi:putative ABC transport system ATP-binding protein
VMDLFRSLADSDRTIIVVTHDERVATAMDRVIRLENGSIESDLVSKPVKKPKSIKKGAKL